jgi:hypothetical protein
MTRVYVPTTLAVLATYVDNGYISGRRVVVVAEVTYEDGPVAMEQVVAVHADTDDEHEPDDDLGWFATQEIQYLI